MKTNKNGGIYRQGDVLILPTDKIPTGLKKTNKVTLALGEMTGHHHSITDEGCVGFAEDENGLAKWLNVTGDSVTLTHQEHAPISIPAGDYEIVTQVEYTPQALRNVAD